MESQLKKVNVRDFQREYELGNVRLSTKHEVDL